MRPNMGPPIIILGAGGNARVLLSIMRAQELPVFGCVAPEAPDVQRWPGDVRYLGADDTLGGLDPLGYVLVNGLGSVGRAPSRQRIFDYATRLGFRFRSLIHASAIIDPSAHIDETALIMAGVIIQPGAIIGQNVLLNTGVIIEHDCKIGAHTHVATGARLAGSVVVGEAAHIGAGASVIQEQTIGARAVVAAGAVVIRPVDAGTCVGGVPARPLKSLG